MPVANDARLAAVVVYVGATANPAEGAQQARPDAVRPL
jgi:hypothetical protein